MHSGTNIIEPAHEKMVLITKANRQDSGQPAQSHQSLCSLLTQYRELEEAADK